MAVLCNSLLLRFPGMLLRYLLSNYDMVLPAPIITGITFVVTFHTRIPPEIAILMADALLFHYHGLWCPVYLLGMVLLVFTSSIIINIRYTIAARLSHRGLSTNRYRFLRSAQPCRSSGLTCQAGTGMRAVHSVERVTTTQWFLLLLLLYHHYHHHHQQQQQQLDQWVS
jgi:hypothetical protein